MNAYILFDDRALVEDEMYESAIELLICFMVFCPRNESWQLNKNPSDETELSSQVVTIVFIFLYR